MPRVILSRMGTIIVALIFLGSLAGTIWIYEVSYSDITIRGFSFNDHQVSYNDVYSVADIPIIHKIKLVGNKRLEFHFLPEIRASRWTIKYQDRFDSKKTVHTTVVEGPYPQVEFAGLHASVDRNYWFEPEGVKLNWPIDIEVNYVPKELFKEADLSWPDNYWSPFSTVPWGFKKPYSVDEWVGLPANDPDLIAARTIVRGHYDAADPTLKKIEDIFRFTVSEVNRGIPSDKIQNASPLEVYRLIHVGQKGKGWCENLSVVYYLMANTAGIKTRIVQLGGKIGPMKLSGHAFDESWVPEQGRWIYVDPEEMIAYVQNSKTGVYLNGFELKQLANLNNYEGYTETIWDPGKKEIATQPLTTIPDVFKNDLALAYNLGFMRNKTFPRLRNYLFHPRMVLCEFTIPDYYVINRLLLYTALISFIILVILVLKLRFSTLRRRRMDPKRSTALGAVTTEERR